MITFTFSRSVFHSRNSCLSMKFWIVLFTCEGIEPPGEEEDIRDN